MMMFFNQALPACQSRHSALQHRHFSSDTDDDIPRENLPISRFPVPDRNTLDEDIQQRMNEVEEKVLNTQNTVLSVIYLHVL